MSLTFTPQVEIEDWRPITVGEDSFEVRVKAATMGDRLADTEHLSLSDSTDGSWLENRLRSSIVDWRGVQSPDGKPIPFSWEALSALCTAKPAVLTQLVMRAHEAFREATETEAGNS